MIPLLLLLVLAQPAVNPYRTLKYDKVVICDFENNGDSDSPLLDASGAYTKYVNKTAILSPVQIDTMVARLGNRASYGRPRAMCFEPHFGVLFFQKNKLVAEVEICLDCNGLSTTLPIPAMQQGRRGTGTHMYYALDGLSQSFRKYIGALATLYGFPHRPK